MQDKQKALADVLYEQSHALYRDGDREEALLVALRAKKAIGEFIDWAIEQY